MLLLVSTGDDLDIHGDPKTIWRPWVGGELRSRPIHSGPHQAEQAPEELAQALLEFLGPNGQGEAAICRTVPPRIRLPGSVHDACAPQRRC